MERALEKIAAQQSDSYKDDNATLISNQNLYDKWILVLFFFPYFGVVSHYFLVPLTS